MTNMRAYKDGGTRLVLVIENPTRDLESLVASLISGEIGAVKDLEKPKAMAKPSIDTRHMEEIKPSAKEECTPVGPSAPKLPKFVKDLKRKKDDIDITAETTAVETRNVAEVNEILANSIIPEKETVAASVEETTEKPILDIAKSEEPLEAEPKKTEQEIVIEEIIIDDEKEETVVTSVPVSTAPVPAEPEEMATNVPLAMNVPEPALVESAESVKEIATEIKENVTRPTTPDTKSSNEGQNREYMTLLKFVSLHKNSPMVRSELMKRYRNPAYPIERLSLNQLRWFSDKLRKH